MIRGLGTQISGDLNRPQSDSRSSYSTMKETTTREKAHATKSIRGHARPSCRAAPLLGFDLASLQRPRAELSERIFVRAWAVNRWQWNIQ